MLTKKSCDRRHQRASPARAAARQLNQTMDRRAFRKRSGLGVAPARSPPSCPTTSSAPPRLRAAGASRAEGKAEVRRTVKSTVRWAVPPTPSCATACRFAGVRLADQPRRTRAKGAALR